MIWSFVFLNLTVVLLACRLRFGGEGLEFASPVHIDAGLWWWLIAASAVTAVLPAARTVRRTMSDTTTRRAAAELLVIPALLAFEWGVLPAYPWQYRWFDWAGQAAAVLVVAVAFVRDWPNRSRWGLGWANLIAAARLLALPTALFIAVPLAARLWLPAPIDAGRTAVSLVTYPLYALAQLLLFQVFLVRRLTKISPSPWAVIAVSGLTFALAHWPNPVLMAACLPAGAVWTWVYLRRPNVYALAISMGLAAAVVANVLPREAVLSNMRTGPIFVERLLDARTQ